MMREPPKPSKVSTEINSMFGDTNIMFIYDGEIKMRHRAKFDQIIADLDADHSTQKGMATRPPEARYRPAVEKYLAALPKDEPAADEGS